MEFCHIDASCEPVDERGVTQYLDGIRHRMVFGSMSYSYNGCRLRQGARKHAPGVEEETVMIARQSAARHQATCRKRITSQTVENRTGESRPIGHRAMQCALMIRRYEELMGMIRGINAGCWKQKQHNYHAPQPARLIFLCSRFTAAQ